MLLGTRQDHNEAQRVELGFDNWCAHGNVPFG